MPTPARSLDGGGRGRPQDHAASREIAPVAAHDVAQNPDVSLGFLRGGLGFKLWLAQSAFRRDLATRLATMDLTPRQCALLELVHSNPGVSQATLAHTLGIDSSTMMAMIARLELRGLLERRRSIADKRRQELHILEPGNTACRAAEALVAENEGRFSDLFDADEQAMLIDFLSRIHARS